MAHYRVRYIESWIQKMMGYSPIVGLFGHRQVGKTSLAERLSDVYFTMDDKTSLQLAESSPHEFLLGAARRNKTVIIDECQLSPALFPALKEYVRVHKKPGQFILTGSVRFTSRKVIRESLTGRIVNIVIPPLGSGEICEINEPKVMETVLTLGLESGLRRAHRTLGNVGIAKNLISTTAKFGTYGGLPGVCFIRNQNVRNSKIASQIETILERDLRQILDTTLPHTTLLRVLKELAANVGEPLNLASIQRKTRVSVNTLRRLLAAFNAMFLIEIVSPMEGNGQPSIFFIDPGEAFFLAEGRLSQSQVLAQAIYSNAIATCSALWDSKVGPLAVNCHRTRGGTDIPIVLRTTKAAFGLLPWSEGMHFESVLAQTKSFMKVTGARGVILISSEGTEVKRHHEYLIELPHHIFIS